MVRAMVEVLLLNAIKHNANSLEFRTINDEFRVAFIDPEGAHESPSPPNSAKDFLLDHCRRIVTSASHDAKSVIRLGDGVAHVAIESDEDSFVWYISDNSISPDDCDVALNEFWAMRQKLTSWQHRIRRFLLSIHGGEPQSWYWRYFALPTQTPRRGYLPRSPTEGPSQFILPMNMTETVSWRFTERQLTARVW